MDIGFLNIQGGRRRETWIELQTRMIEYDISVFGVAETHLRDLESPDLLSGFQWYGVNREGSEKQGGGVRIIFRDSILCREVRSCKEHIWIDIQTTFGSMLMAIVYMDTRRDADAWNSSIFRCLTADFANLNPTYLVGDFNGHLLELDGREDSTGRATKEFAIAHDLYIINLDPQLTAGKSTWSARGFCSSIDFALCNEPLRNLLKGLTIDEDGILGVGSDHNALVTSFLGARPRQINDPVVQCQTRWRTNVPEKMESFSQEVESRVVALPEVSYQALQETILQSAHKQLGVSSPDSRQRLQRRWFNKKVKLAIRVRREANRKYRKIAKKKDKSPTIIAETDRLWKIFLSEKHRVKQLVSTKIKQINVRVELDINLLDVWRIKNFGNCFEITRLLKDTRL